ncbi:hypothetical protein GP2_030_00440 [Gordonia paraffinivorans NBRC 108238]|uniref:Uncharacterized protein n=1 Tax=Gordonia paraffinivorans NBRC 108238 TaxID=1223543 RepID=A0ABQ0INL6_9ACTN|nr:hypothetical protein GP2_030_00440 [Gordonia paraffinivorans NBRC 108238]
MQPPALVERVIPATPRRTRTEPGQVTMRTPRNTVTGHHAPGRAAGSRSRERTYLPGRPPPEALDRGPVARFSHMTDGLSRVWSVRAGSGPKNLAALDTGASM